MALKKTKRSRSASRSRAASRGSSKKRSSSRRSASKPRAPASESRASRHKPSPSLSHDSLEVSPVKSVRNRSQKSVRQSAVRSSLRIIEKLDSTQGADVKPSAISNKTAEIPSFFRKSLDVAKSLLFAICRCIFSEATLCLLALPIIPGFVMWINLMVFSSTSLESKKFATSVWGPGVSFLGVVWPTNWRVYLNPFVALGVLTFVAFVMVVACAFPFGKRFTVIAGGRRTGVKANGLFLLILFKALFGLVLWKGDTFVPGLSPSMLFDYWPALLTTCVILAIIISEFLWYHARPQNSSVFSAKLGKAVTDFYYGSEVRPGVLSNDVKLLLTYPSMIGMRMLEMCLFLRQYEQNSRVSPALLLTMFLHGISTLDYFIFEPTFLSSYSMNHDGLGYYRLVGMLVVVPFAHSINLFYLATNYTAGHPTIELKSTVGAAYIFSIALFLVGLWIQRSANSEKYMFRRDPHHPKFADMDTFPTMSGKRLLAGGWWGRIRHPNYLGDVLMAFAAAVPAGLSSPLPWIFPVLLLMYLTRRAIVVERSCSSKYGFSWSKYSNFVPYRFIPRVY